MLDLCAQPEAKLNIAIAEMLQMASNLMGMERNIV